MRQNLIRNEPASNDKEDGNIEVNTVANEIFRLLSLLKDSQKKKDQDKVTGCEVDLDDITHKKLRLGGGLNGETFIHYAKGLPNKFIIKTEYQTIGQAGGMPGSWSNHTVTVIKDESNQISVRVTGGFDRDLNEYLSETFLEVLLQSP